MDARVVKDGLRLILVDIPAKYEHDDVCFLSRHMDNYLSNVHFNLF